LPQHQQWFIYQFLGSPYSNKAITGVTPKASLRVAWSSSIGGILPWKKSLTCKGIDFRVLKYREDRKRDQAGKRNGRKWFQYHKGDFVNW
jgi:hypothetical protein